MKQSRTRLAAIIADKALKSGVTTELSKEVAAYLLTERRVAELDSVLRDVQDVWAKSGFIEVLAYSAFPLTAEVKQEIVNQVRNIYPEATEIRITESIDPEVIGGVRLSLPNKQLDLSVESKLDRFKQLTMAGKE